MRDEDTEYSGDEAINDMTSLPDATSPEVPPETPPGMKWVNPFAVARDKNATGGGFLRCPAVKMDHRTGALLIERGKDKEKLESRRFVCNPTLLVDRWAKWVGGKLVDERVYRIADGEIGPADREEFGLDLDKRQWPRDSRGEQRDPWSRTVYLPLKTADGTDLCFQATGKSAIAEIFEFCFQYSSADRHGKVPEVDIDSRSWDGDYGTIFVPVFRLVGWELWNGQPTPGPKLMLVPIEAPAAPKPKALPSRRDDMDDEIPF